MPAPVLAVIPARYGSVRLPGKPLRMLGDRPIVEWVRSRVEAMPAVDRVVVATDHDEVRRAVRAAGGEAVLTSPRHPSGTDRVAEAAALPELAGYEVIVNVQGDEVGIEDEHVEEPVALLSEGWSVATCAAPITDESAWRNPAVVKVARAPGGAALYFSRAPIPHARDEPFQPDDPRWLHHVGVYVYTREALERWVALEPSPLERTEKLEQLRPLEAGLRIGVAIVDRAPRGIDTEEDLADARDGAAPHTNEGR